MMIAAPRARSRDASSSSSRWVTASPTKSDMTPPYPDGGMYARPVPYDADPRVDDYIEGLPAWQQAICRQVRELVHAADSEIAETVKRRVRPYFVLGGNVCALLAAKDHVNVFLYDGAIVPDPEGIITSGHANSTARTVAVRRGEPVPREPVAAMLRQIVANNRAGGWRAIKRRQS